MTTAVSRFSFIGGTPGHVSRKNCELTNETKYVFSSVRSVLDVPDQNSDVDEGQEEEKEEKEGSGGSWLIHHFHAPTSDSYAPTFNR